MSVTTMGLLLAGGASSRFGGRDKAWVQLGGRPLLCHSWQRLAAQVDTAMVSANRHLWAYRRLGVATISDPVRWRGRGPLAAIATALTTVPVDRLAIAPVDAPLAPRDYVARLDHALSHGGLAAAVHDGQRRQPLFALLRRELADAAVAALSRDRVPAMRDWLDQVDAVWVDCSDQAMAFANINTPADLTAIAGTIAPCKPD